MLVLSRHIGEKIHIGDNVTVVITRISGNTARIGIDAPANVPILRGELKEQYDAFDKEEFVSGPVLGEICE